MPVASIPAPGIVTLALVLVAVLVVAVFLLSIGMVLRKASAGLNLVIAAVEQIPGRTDPVEPVLRGINKDLGIARGVLEGLLVKKLGALPDREGMVRHDRSTAQAENAPAGAARSARAPAGPAPIAYQPAAAAPAPAEPSPGLISYSRTVGPPPTPAAEPAEPAAPEPSPGLISYRRGAGPPPAPESAPPAPAPAAAAPAPAAAPPPPASPQPAGLGSVSAELVQIAELRRQGILNEDEFAAAKAAVLR